VEKIGHHIRPYGEPERTWSDHHLWDCFDDNEIKIKHRHGEALAPMRGSHDWYRRALGSEGTLTARWRPNRRRRKPLQTDQRKPVWIQYEGRRKKEAGRTFEFYATYAALFGHYLHIGINNKTLHDVKARRETFGPLPKFVLLYPDLHHSSSTCPCLKKVKLLWQQISSVGAPELASPCAPRDKSQTPYKRRHVGLPDLDPLSSLSPLPENSLSLTTRYNYRLAFHSRPGANWPSSTRSCEVEIT
jgi:hypothetical protein